MQADISQYWQICFGWNVESVRFKRARNREEVLGMLDKSAIAQRSLMHGRMRLYPIKKRDYCAGRVSHQHSTFNLAKTRQITWVAATFMVG